MRDTSWVGGAAFPALFAGLLMLLFVHPAAAAVGGGASYFPNTELINQDGKTVHFYDDLIKGKIVAINFIYTTCQYSCPLETARLAQVQSMLGDRVGRDIFFYSISIDPVHDTPAALKSYAEKFHVGPGWEFLTGNKEDIDTLRKKLGMYSDPSANKDGHLPHLLIGNEASGQWLRDSATDNPYFLSNLIGNFVDTWRNHQVTATKDGETAPVRLGHTGQYLFGKQCAACHTVGHGDKIGPDLEGVAAARGTTWLTRYIAEPDKVLASDDPIAKALNARYKLPMPNLRLGDLDVSAIISFLSAPASLAGPPPSGESDPDITKTASTANNK